MVNSDQIRLLSVVCLALVIGVAIGACVTYAVLTSSKRIPNTAQLKTVGIDVFSDPACTVPVLHINCDLIGPGETKDLQACIKNTGNSPITLALSTEAWSPSSAQSMPTLGWDYDDSIVTPLSYVIANSGQKWKGDTRFMNSTVNALRI